jgi:hypothetical protein
VLCSTIAALINSVSAVQLFELLSSPDGVHWIDAWTVDPRDAKSVMIRLRLSLARMQPFSEVPVRMSTLTVNLLSQSSWPTVPLHVSTILFIRRMRLSHCINPDDVSTEMWTSLPESVKQPRPGRSSPVVAVVLAVVVKLEVSDELADVICVVDSVVVWDEVAVLDAVDVPVDESVDETVDFAVDVAVVDSLVVTEDVAVVEPDVIAVELPDEVAVLLGLVVTVVDAEVDAEEDTVVVCDEVAVLVCVVTAQPRKLPSRYPSMAALKCSAVASHTPAGATR